MTFQTPYRSSDDEARKALEAGERRMGEHPAPPSARGVVITLAWVAALAVIGWLLIQSGLLDPTFCHTANPISC